MHVNELKAKSPQQLLKMAEDMGIENPSQLNVQQLRFAVMRVFAADNKITLIGDGVLERMQDGFGFLRAPESNYLAGPDDLYVSPNLIKKYGLIISRVKSKPPRMNLNAISHWKRLNASMATRPTNYVTVCRLMI